MNAPDRRRPRPGRPASRNHPLTLRELNADPEYLRIKQQLGEVLSPQERAMLDAARSAPGPKRAGGEP